MKIYSGTMTCRCCGKTFRWECLDDRYKLSSNEVPEFIEITANPDIAKLKRNVFIPGQSEFFEGHCPYCQRDIAIECNQEQLSVAEYIESTPGDLRTESE